MAYRVLIVEDTPADADALRACLGRYAAEHDVALDVRTVRSAVDFVSTRRQADLVFMDIGMPGLNGLEAAEELRTYDEQTPLVFVTTLAQYAVRGYEVEALDFVVKPVTYEAFAPRMDRAMRVVRRREGQTVALATPDGVRVVRLADVTYVDITHHDLNYHLAGEPEPLRRRGTIRQAAQELGDKGFVKLSASCLANMAQVVRIRQGSVVMEDGTELWFSRSQRKAALERLASYVGGSA